MMEGTDRRIDARSIVSLIVFIVVNFFVIFPLFFTFSISWFKSSSSSKGEDAKNLDGPREQHRGDGANSQEDEDLEGRADRSNRVNRGSSQDHHPDRHGQKGEKDEKDQGRQDVTFKLGLETAPVIGVLLLLASTCIPGRVIRDGIVGTEGVKPYDIMTLFLCFAYISISLDATGILRYTAFAVGNKYASNGPRLYTAFYAFYAILGLLIGNDPLILSGTPFLVYFTDHAAIDPSTGFLFTHFQVSNLVSALLVSSNPTNLVLTSAFDISFLQYSAWLALPTVASVIVLFPVLRYWLFGSTKFIPPKLSPPHVKARDALHDPRGGIFGTVLFVITIVLLVGLSAGKLLEGWKGVWTVTLPAALAMFLWDCVSDLRDPKRRERANKASIRPTSQSVDIDAEKRDHAAVSTEASSSTTPTTCPTTPKETEHSEGDASPKEDKVAWIFTIPPLSLFAKTFPTATHTLSRMPFALVPFALSMFILVEALQHTGWIRVFGKWWIAWAEVGGVAGCVWLMAMLSVIGCNLFGTNIGATILLSRVLQYWQQANGPVSQRSLYGAVFALAVGSNFGAYSFVFSASLAGLLWRTILIQKGRQVTKLQFIRYNTIPVIITMIVGSLVVAGEVCIMYKS